MHVVKPLFLLFQKLVHSMVAEQLNSSSWRHKVIASKILPTLKGDINRVMNFELSYLLVLSQ